MKKIYQKILLPLLSLATAIGCFVTVGGDKKIKSSADTQLPDTYVTLSHSEATFAYQALPEAYQNVYTYGEYAQKTNVKGAMVFSAVNNDTSAGLDVSMTFSTNVSAKQLRRSFNLFEYLIITDELGWKSGEIKDNPPFSSISLTLTEKANPENFVKISNVPSPYHNYQSIARASATKISSAGMGVTGSFYDSSGVLSGSSVRGSLSGCYLEGENSVRDIYSVSYKYDYESNSAYAYPTDNKDKEGRNLDILVRDFDSKAHMLGLDELFGGFETDELIASVSFDGLKGKAEIAVLSFNGAKLYGDSAQAIEDTNTPNVFATNYEEGVSAEVGVSFPVFDFASYDDIDGLSGIDGYKVYYDYEKSTQTEIPVTNGRFIPEKVGEYTVVAEKTDSSLNKGTGVYKIHALKKLPPFIVSLQNSIAPYATVGHKVTLPDAFVTGGTVGTTYDLHVLHNGEEIVLDKWNSFILQSQGLYTVRYSVYDYRKVPVFFDYYIEAKLDKVPIVEFPNMPKYVAVGSTLAIPEFSAVDWYSYAGMPCDAVVSATVTKAGEQAQEVGAEYTVEEAGTFTYTLTAKSVKGKESISKDYIIQAVETELVSDYFIRNKVVISGEEEIIFEAQENGASFAFINPLPVDNFALKFFMPTEYKNFSKLTITFSDRFAVDEKVTIDCTPSGKSSYIHLCGEAVKVDSSFDGALGNSDFALAFKGLSLYNSGDEVGQISSYDNGAEFVGFSSGYVYVEFGFSEMQGKSGIQLKTLGNHSYFEKDATDISAPMVRIAEEFSSIIKIGSIIHLPKITAYDVFDCERAVTVRVLKDGKAIPIVDNAFAVTEFGVYNLRIETTDTTGHKTTMNKNMYCHNQTGPTIIVQDKMETSGKVGERIQIAPAKAVDYFGKEVSVRMFVLKKGGAYVMIDENNGFTPDEKTEYVVWYTATDSDFNTTVIKFIVKV